LTREDKVFGRGGAYVVGMTGQKWAKGWLLILQPVRNMAIRPGGSKNGSAFQRSSGFRPVPLATHANIRPPIA
jgi:hypothetical protein